MARLLLLHHHHLSIQTLMHLPSTTTLLLLLATLAAVSSMVMFLCSNHRHSKVKKMFQKERAQASLCPSGERKLLSSFSGLGNKATMVVVKMASWRKTDRDEDEEGDEAVWRKSILMGEKCRPLEFSGQIVYDSEGNQLPEGHLRTHGGGSIA